MGPNSSMVSKAVVAAVPVGQGDDFSNTGWQILRQVQGLREEITKHKSSGTGPDKVRKTLPSLPTPCLASPAQSKCERLFSQPVASSECSGDGMIAVSSSSQRSCQSAGTLQKSVRGLASWQAPESKVLGTSIAGGVVQILGDPLIMISHQAGPLIIQALAAVRIQQYWRHRIANARNKNRTRQFARLCSVPQEMGRGCHHSRAAASEGGSRSFVALHFAASRIQRAWRLSRLRRTFVKFSEENLGWVGEFGWLESHNQTFGAELADVDDLRFWLQQLATAAVDSKVDPWGCQQLRKHLNR